MKPTDIQGKTIWSWNIVLRAIIHVCVFLKSYTIVETHGINLAVLIYPLVVILMTVHFFKLTFILKYLKKAAKYYTPTTSPLQHN